ncbi:MAG: CHASE2 domain-containing protein, partial [Betaproteobacteria bacterium]|nr:CHASE2 domain-containing protein [Betaproteobacteria bacterium]
MARGAGGKQLALEHRIADLQGAHPRLQTARVDAHRNPRGLTSCVWRKRNHRPAHKTHLANCRLCRVRNKGGNGSRSTKCHRNAAPPKQLERAPQARTSLFEAMAKHSESCGLHGSRSPKTRRCAMIAQNSPMAKRSPSHFAQFPKAGMPVLAVLLAAALVVLIAAVHWSKASAPAFRVLEAAVRDGLARWLATEAEDPRIAIVDIDEESLRRLGAWPWPRERLADLSEQLLSDAAASRVILDLVLPQAQGEDGDARLGALAASGLVVLGQVLDYERRDPVLREGELAGGRPLAAAHGGAIASATGFVANHRGLAAGRCVGNIGFQPDFDGQARRLAPWTAFEGQRYPMLSLAALACAPGDADPGRVAAQLPLGASGTWWVPFRRFPRAHLAVPAHEVLAGTVDRSGRLPLLNGRMVLVGSSA